MPGTHEVSGSPSTGSEELDHLIHDINSEISSRKASADPLGNIMPQDAKGSIKIEDVQADLRKFTLFIDYTDAKGVPQKFQKYLYLHKESAYKH